MGYANQLPSGRWQGGFRLKSGRKVTRTFDYEYEALDWVAVAEAAAKAARDIPAAATPEQVAAPSTPTVAAYAADYLARIEGGVAVKTMTGYRSVVRQFPRDLVQMRVSEVTRPDIERWVTRMRREGTGPRTIEARVKMLGQIIRDAIKVHRLKDMDDPTEGVKTPPLKDRPDRTLAPIEEVPLFAAAAATEDPRVEVMILLATDAGLRVGEVFGVTGDSLIVHPDGRAYLDVRQQVTQHNAIEVTKGKARRYVPLTARLAEALAPLAEEAGTRLIFRNARGGLMHYSNWRRDVWHPVLAASGIAPIRFHDLRHTYGSRLAAAGVAVTEIQTLMGHASPKTTERYIHAGTDGRRHDLVRMALEGSNA